MRRCSEGTALRWPKFAKPRPGSLFRPPTGPCPGAGYADQGQGLTLVNFSAQPEPFPTQNTPSTPRSSPETPPKHPLHDPSMQSPIPQEVLTLSREVDECKPLTRGCGWRLWTCGRSGRGGCRRSATPNTPLIHPQYTPNTPPIPRWPPLTPLLHPYYTPTAPSIHSYYTPNTPLLHPQCTPTPPLNQPKYTPNTQVAARPSHLNHAPYPNQGQHLKNILTHWVNAGLQGVKVVRCSFTMSKPVL